MPIGHLVSQVSVPVRVMLVLAVMFMAAWMTVLKPKAEVIPPAEPAPQSAPGAAVDAAQGAVDAVDQRNTAAGASVGVGPGSTPATGSAPATTPSQGTQPAPAAAEAVEAAEEGGLPLKVLRGIADRKVIVLLFWNPKAADDQAVRRELKGIGAHANKGKVLVHVAPLEKVSNFQQITRGANVDQSPTVVVVDGNRQVETLVGFNDRATIHQAVRDALRAGK